MKQKGMLSAAVLLWLTFPLVSPSAQAADVTTQEVHVQADQAKEAAKYESQQTTIITKEDIEKKQAKSVEDIIFSETGMSRQVDAMGRVTVSIRGAEPRHTLIMIDGQPVMGDFAKYSGQGDELQRLGTENVERIEIIQGAASAKYGADAIGGVINVITKQPSKTPGLQVNVEGRRTAGDSDILPYQNFFIRADSGQQGPFRAAVYGGKREIMPVYGTENYTDPDGSRIRNSLRYYGDIKNIGTVFNWDINDNNSLEITADKIKENMERFVKRSESAPNITNKRDVDRNTYGITYKGHNDKTDWKFGYNYAKMKENDISTMQLFKDSPYQGSDGLYYLDDLEHTMKSFNASANTQVNDKHLLTYGFGYSKETGEGSRIKNADDHYYRYINPWDYDKNLVLNMGTVASSIHDYELVNNANGVPYYDQQYEWYGFRDSSGQVAKPAYTYEMYQEYGMQPEYMGASADMIAKAKQFAQELMDQNPDITAAFGGSAYTGPMMLQLYYNGPSMKASGDLDESFIPTWHPAGSTERGKQFQEEYEARNNRQTIGKAEIRKYNFYIGDTWQVNKNTILSPIFRLDHSNLFGSHGTFNVGLTHNVKGKTNHRFKANIGTGYTEPGMGELYYNWEMYSGSPAGTVEGIGSELGRLGYYWVGNRNLKPEKSVNFDIGVEAENGKTSTRFNVFHNRIRDYMTTYFTGYVMDFNPGDSAFKWLSPPDMIYSFKNIGKAEITGFEAQINHTFNKHWSSKLGYTYLHAINKSDPDMPRQLLNKPTHKVDIGVTYENKGWTATLWGDYYIRMLDSNSIANNGNYMTSSESGTHYFFADSDKITYQRKTFGLWNLLVQKKIDKDSLVYFGIDNVLNHRDDDQAFMARTFRFGVNMKFGPTILTPEEKAAKEAARAVKLAKGEAVDADTDELERDWFIQPVFDVNKKQGIELIGDYRARWNSFTGNNHKPDNATVTMTTSVGDAYKNYREKAEHGFEQRLRAGLDARIGDNTNITVLGSASGMSGVDTNHDISSSKGLNHQRLDNVDITQHVKKWDFSAGRITEPMGITGYWFGKEYDGGRAVYTSGKDQVRIGYGTFKHSTGITDSAYTHATRQIFYRAPTSYELLGRTGTYAGMDDDYWTTTYDKENGVKGFGDGKGLYQTLGTQTWEQQKKTLLNVLEKIKAADPEGYAQYVVPKLEAANRLYVNSYAWNKIEVYDKSGNLVNTYLALADCYDLNVYTGEHNNISYTEPLSYNDWLDKDKLEEAAGTVWDRVAADAESTNATYKNVKHTRGIAIPSGHLPVGTYTYKVTFDGYGEYTGDTILKAFLRVPTSDRSRYEEPYIMEYSEKEKALANGTFSVLDRDTARSKAVQSLWNADSALQSWETVYRHSLFDGVQPGGNISPSMRQLFGAVAAWAYEQESNVPIWKLAGIGWVGAVLGTVLVKDQIPSIDMAGFVQYKHQFGDHFGMQAWYLRSFNDDTRSIAYANGDSNDIYSYDRLANIIGLGFKWRLGTNASLSADWGQNRTDFGRMLNGHTNATYVAGTSDIDPDHYDFAGRSKGGTPHFWTVRFDVGQADMDVPGSWNAFADYKYFQHGSFFGGNGTEALPDRYLDGIRSFTIGAGYVPRKDFLLQAFYTFAAKGISKRDTLYGPEKFELGDYTRIQMTYRF